MNNINHINSWSAKALKLLPQMLIKLLEQKNCQSLERLQLVQVDFKLEAPLNEEEIVLSKKHIFLVDEDDQFMTLSGHITQQEQNIISLSVKYFKRGEKKFFKWDKPPLLNNKISFSLDEKERSNKSQQESKDLASLMGRKRIALDNIKLMEAMLAHVETQVSHLSFNFIDSIYAEQELTIGCDRENSDLDLILYGDDAPLLTLRALQ